MFCWKSMCGPKMIILESFHPDALYLIHMVAVSISPYYGDNFLEDNLPLSTGKYVFYVLSIICNIESDLMEASIMRTGCGLKVLHFQ